MFNRLYAVLPFDVFLRPVELFFRGFGNHELAERYGWRNGLHAGRGGGEVKEDLALTGRIHGNRHGVVAVESSGNCIATGFDVSEKKLTATIRVFKSGADPKVQQLHL